MIIITIPSQGKGKGKRGEIVQSGEEQDQGDVIHLSKFLMGG